MITRLIWTIWTLMSSVPKKADKLNLSPNLPNWYPVFIRDCFLDKQYELGHRPVSNVQPTQCWMKCNHWLLWWQTLRWVFAPALPELLWLPTVWRCPYIEIAFSTLDCSIVPTCGAWCSATAAKRGPLKQSWAEIQHSRDDEPLGVLMQMRNVRVNGFFFFSSLGVLPGVLVDTLSLCSGDFCVECVLIVLHKFYIEL